MATHHPMTTKHLVFLVVLAVIGLVLVWNVHDPLIPAQAPKTPQAGSGLDVVYYGNDFSIRVPREYRIEEGFGADVLFYVGTSTTAGTNLAEDTSISVSELARDKTCTADMFIDGKQDLVSREVIDESVTYSFASSTDAAAGNRYEFVAYALPDLCVGIIYKIHYGAIENYPVGAVKEFDKAALLKEFDAIRRTLVVAP